MLHTLDHPCRKVPSAGGARNVPARAAGLAMTKIMAAELAPHCMLVNALCVGLILPDQWKRFHANNRPEASFDEYVAGLTKAVRLGRICTSEEFANVACFLASDLASYLTGTAINVDGGLCPVLYTAEESHAVRTPRLASIGQSAAECVSCRFDAKHAADCMLALERNYFLIQWLAWHGTGV